MTEELNRLVLEDAIKMLLVDVWNTENQREHDRLERRARGHLKFLVNYYRGSECEGILKPIVEVEA